MILAQRVACLAVARWAQLSPKSYLTAVRGALFRSPLHIGFGQARIAANARTGPTHRLPVPSVVANDVSPYVEQVLALAHRSPAFRTSETRPCRGPLFGSYEIDTEDLAAIAASVRSLRDIVETVSLEWLEKLRTDAGL